MTFLAYETSDRNGSPVELYEFTFNNQTILLTSHSDDYLWTIKNYVADVLKRSELMESQNGVKNNLTIETTNDNKILKLFKLSSPEYQIILNLYRVHSLDPNQERKEIFYGKLISAEEQGFSGKLVFEPFIGGAKNRVLIPTYQRKCNNTIFDDNCGLLFSAHQIVLPITGGSGKVLTVAGLNAVLSDADAKGGIVKDQSGIYSMIESKSTDTITIFKLLGQSEINDILYIYPGCQQLASRCKQLGNYDNFFGFNDTPIKDLHSETGVKGDV